MFLLNIQHHLIKLMKSDTFWKKAAWVGGGLVLFQLFYFFNLYIPELKERWNDLKPLVKYGAVLLVLLTSCIVTYQFYFSKKPILKRYSIYLFRLILSLYLLQWIFVILYWFSNPPLTFTQLGSLFSGYGLKRDYVSYSETVSYTHLDVYKRQPSKFSLLGVQPNLTITSFLEGIISTNCPSNPSIRKESSGNPDLRG